MKRLALMFAALAMILGACGGSAPAPTNTPAPTETPLPTATPQPTPTPAPTTTQIPTATPRSRPTPQPAVPASGAKPKPTDLLAEEDLPEGFVVLDQDEDSVQFANEARNEVIGVGVVDLENVIAADMFGELLTDPDTVAQTLGLDLDGALEAVKAWQRYGEQSFGFSGVVRIDDQRLSADVLFVRVSSTFGFLFYLYPLNATPSVNMDYLGNLIAQRLADVLGSTAPDVREDTTTGERYYERDGGFSYVPPAGWQPFEIGGLKFKSFAAPRAVDDFTANIVFTDDRFSGSLERYIEVNLAQLTRLYPDLEVVEQSDVGLRNKEGVPYAWVVIERSERGQQIRQHLYLFDGGSRKFVMTYTRLAESLEHDEYDVLVEQTAASFRLER